MGVFLGLLLARFLDPIGFLLALVGSMKLKQRWQVVYVGLAVAVVMSVIMQVYFGVAQTAQKFLVGVVVAIVHSWLCYEVLTKLRPKSSEKEGRARVEPPMMSDSVSQDVANPDEPLVDVRELMAMSAETQCRRKLRDRVKRLGVEADEDEEAASKLSAEFMRRVLHKIGLVPSGLSDDQRFSVLVSSMAVSDEMSNGCHMPFEKIVIGSAVGLFGNTKVMQEMGEVGACYNRMQAHTSQREILDSIRFHARAWGDGNEDEGINKMTGLLKILMKSVG